jgi:hypothetical protein
MKLCDADICNLWSSVYDSVWTSVTDIIRSEDDVE